MSARRVSSEMVREPVRPSPSPSLPHTPLDRRSWTARLLDVVRGSPPSPAAPRVFVTTSVRAVAATHGITALASLASAIVAFLELAITVREPRAGALLVPSPYAFGALLLILVSVALVQLRAAARLVKGDARGHRVIQILNGVLLAAVPLSVVASRYTSVVAFTGSWWDLGLAIGIPAAMLGVLRRWRPGTLAPEQNDDR